MKIVGINHIGIAAKDPIKAKWFFDQVLGLPYLGEELVSSQKTNTLMFQSGAGLKSPEARLELLINESGQNGPIKKFVEERGGGIHHIALQVEDIRAALAELKTQNVELIDQEPRAGAHHTQIAFVHPRSTGGILIELVQASQSPAHP